MGIMKQVKIICLIVTFSLILGHLGAEGLITEKLSSRSPEGSAALEQLHKDIILTFKSEKIRKRYLAARKLVQLNKDELNATLLLAAIESMRCNNPHYKWFVAHYLQRISGKKHGLNFQAWRNWLREVYISTERPVAKAYKALPKKMPAKELKSKLNHQETPDSVKGIDVDQSDNLTESADAVLPEEEPGVETNEVEEVIDGAGLGDTGVEQKRKEIEAKKALEAEVSASDAQGGSEQPDDYNE
jgi:hypothetical protein